MPALTANQQQGKKIADDGTRELNQARDDEAKAAAAKRDAENAIMKAEQNIAQAKRTIEDTKKAIAQAKKAQEAAQKKIADGQAMMQGG